MMQQQPHNIQQFVEACRGLDYEAIYTLFEEVISNQLRDEIYVCYADPESPEPMRSAMEALGKKFNVESLLKY